MAFISQESRTIQIHKEPRQKVLFSSPWLFIPQNCASSFRRARSSWVLQLSRQVLAQDVTKCYRVRFYALGRGSCSPEWTKWVQIRTLFACIMEDLFKDERTQPCLLSVSLNLTPKPLISFSSSSKPVCRSHHLSIAAPPLISAKQVLQAPFPQCPDHTFTPYGPVTSAPIRGGWPLLASANHRAALQVLFGISCSGINDVQSVLKATPRRELLLVWRNRPTECVSPRLRFISRSPEPGLAFFDFFVTSTPLISTFLDHHAHDLCSPSCYSSVCCSGPCDVPPFHRSHHQDRSASPMFGQLPANLQE